MPQKEFISRFSPNQTSPEVLERMLVQRNAMIEEAVALCIESINTAEKHQLLFVGPRGIGKTHLLTLIAHRIEAKVKAPYCLAWLNEDRTKASYLQLLLQIHEALSARYPDDFPKEEIIELKKIHPDTIESTWEEHLLNRTQGHTVLLLMENLDSAFKDMKTAEQKKWRSLIQNSRQFAIVATAQSLTNCFTNHKEPFYGFFKTWHLKPLTAKETSELLKNIARIHENEEMAAYLDSTDGRARIYALHSLAGGNPRLFVFLSDILSQQTLDGYGAIEDFEEMIDQQLTPYYQERLRWISPQQREIVEYLCSQNSPIAVKNMSQATFIPHSTLTSQLKSLKELGYVTNTTRGRESLYELSEPLMRIAMQVKDVCGLQPLKAIVNFLLVWYRNEEIEKIVATTNLTTEQGQRRRLYAKAVHHEILSSSKNLCSQILSEHVRYIDPEICNEEEFDILKTVASFKDNPAPEAILKYASACIEKKEYQEAMEYSEKILSNSNSSPDNIAEAWRIKSQGLSYTGNQQEANVCYTRSIEMKKTPLSTVTKTFCDRKGVYSDRGEKEQSILDFTKMIELDDATPSSVALAFSFVLRRNEEIHDVRIENSKEGWQWITELDNEKGNPEIALICLRAVLTLRKGNSWKKGMESVSKALRNGNLAEFPAYSLLAEAIIEELLKEGLAAWSTKAKEVVDLFAEYGGLAVLGNALVLKIKALRERSLSESALDNWLTAWTNASNGLEKMALPLRLLSAGVEWIKSRKKNALLSLNLQERPLAQIALGLRDESED